MILVSSPLHRHGNGLQSGPDAETRTHDAILGPDRRQEALNILLLLLLFRCAVL